MKKLLGTLVILAIALTGAGCVHMHGGHHRAGSQIGFDYHYDTGSIHYVYHGHTPKHHAPIFHGHRAPKFHGHSAPNLMDKGSDPVDTDQAVRDMVLAVTAGASKNRKI